MTAEPPLALYIHWPFCVAKCPYCDFNSHVRAAVDIPAWRAALLAELRYEAERTGARRLGSIFFGGGTPSLMPPALTAGLIDAALGLWRAEPDLEVTLEANPNSAEAAHFRELASAGVNRISLGLQALDDQALGFLGREHDLAEGLAALDAAQQAVERVSFDLIYARPEQTPEQWERELNRALGFGTSHLSLYQLTIEPGTRFATLLRTGQLTPLDDDLAADLFALTGELTDAAGLPAYEISNHAAPGAESRHNLSYWRYGDYIGIGPGAHGRRNRAATRRHKKPETWLDAVRRNGQGLAEEQPLDPPTRATEALLMGLRLSEGVDLARIAARSGVAERRLLDPAALDRLTRLGLVAARGSRVALTPAGRPLLDAILAELVAVDCALPA